MITKISFQLMECLKDPFILFLTVLSTFILIFINRGRRKLPPGPLGLPIVGNMLMVKLTHQGLGRLSEIYGGIYHLRLGFLDAVIISTPEMARQVLQVQDNVFSNRPATIAIEYLTYNRADMVFAHYGPFWRQMRKLCVMKLFSRGHAETWTSIRDEVNSAIKTTSTKIGTSVNIRDLTFNLTKNIVYRSAFGAKMSHDDGDEYICLLQEFSKLFGVFNIGDFVPWLKWMDLNGINVRLKNARAALDRFIDPIIDGHLANPKETDAPNTDMVDNMLAFLAEAGGVKDQTGDPHSQGFPRLTRQNIKAIIMDVMFGGTETIALGIEWTMATLLKNPEHMKQVQQELADVIGMDRMIHESDLDQLPYLKNAVKETLRLHPPIPLLLHETSEDCEIAGYSIPKQSRVMINVWAIGRDKSAWKDADSFKPDRFEPGSDTANIDFKGNFFELLPFGSGRRSCPGMQLGLYALELAVANLMHCFDWTLPDGMKPSELDMDDVFGLTAPRAVPLMAVPSPRLNCQVA